MRESKIERAHVERVEKRGGISYKFTSPQRRGVPDRLDLRGIDSAAEQVYQLAAASGVRLSQRACREWAQRIIEQAIRFTETKAPGGTPDAHQAREHERIRALGIRVDVLDNRG